MLRFDPSGQNAHVTFMPDLADQAAAEFTLPSDLVDLRNDDAILDWFDFAAAGYACQPSSSPQPQQCLEKSIRTNFPDLVPSVVGNGTEHGSDEAHNAIQRASGLNTWLSAHQVDPYFDGKDREDLAQMTGLSQKQVATYFTNYRRRKLIRIDQGLSGVNNKVNALDSIPKRLPECSVPTTSNLKAFSDRSLSSISDHSAVSREARPASAYLQDVDTLFEVGDLARWSQLTKQQQPLQSKLAEFNGDVIAWYLNGSDPENCGCLADCDGQCMGCGSLRCGSEDMSCTQELSVLGDQMASPTPYASYSGNEEKASPMDWSADEQEQASTNAQRLGSFTGNIRLSDHRTYFPRRRSDSSEPRMELPDSRSEASSNASSMQSASSYASLGSRRGRHAYGGVAKRKGGKLRPRGPPKSTLRAMKQAHTCEECGECFATRYTKRRHFESIHQAKHHWVCGPILLNGDLACPICLSSPLHCPHSGLECWKRGRDERTYYRKDAFTQHLKNMHDLTSSAATLFTRHQHFEMPRRYAGLRAEIEEVGCMLVQMKSAAWTFIYSQESEECDSRYFFETSWILALGQYFGEAYWTEAFSSPSPFQSVRGSIERPFAKTLYQILRSGLGSRMEIGQNTSDGVRQASALGRLA